MLKQLSTLHRLVTFVWKLWTLVQQPKISHFSPQNWTNKRLFFFCLVLSLIREARVSFSLQHETEDSMQLKHKKERKIYIFWDGFVVWIFPGLWYWRDGARIYMHLFLIYSLMLMKKQVKFLGKCVCIAVGVVRNGWNTMRYESFTKSFILETEKLNTRVFVLVYWWKYSIYQLSLYWEIPLTLSIENSQNTFPTLLPLLPLERAYDYSPIIISEAFYSFFLCFQMCFHGIPM